MRLSGVFLFLASVALGGEFAVFRTGARQHIDWHEAVDGGRVRLYSGGGYTEMNGRDIRGFEDDGVPRLEAAPAAAVASAPADPGPQPAPNLTPAQLADRAADKYGLPRELVRSVMAVESGFAPQAVSPKGAVGLMQLMPTTAQALGADAQDPAQNVDAGTRYLRDLLLRYDGALWHALAAYNAGPGAVDKYKDIPPYQETIRYIGRVDHALKKVD